MMSAKGLEAPTVPVGTTDSMVNINEFVDKDKAIALNADNATSIASLFGSGHGLLKSDQDVDAQLLLIIPFREKVKIRGVKFAAEAKLQSAAAGPRRVRLLVDQPDVAFGDVETLPAVQELTLTPADLAGGGVGQRLKFVKFQNVSSVTMFIEDNQDDADVTFLSRIEFIGAPIDGMRVADIKKIEEQE